MSGIGPSISLKGEKEFRQAISAINNEMKVLGSEMNKVTAEFSDKLEISRRPESSKRSIKQRDREADG